MADMTLQEYLQKLFAERAALDVKIAGVQQALGLEVQLQDGVGVGNGAAPPAVASGRSGIVTGRVRSDEFFRMSIPEAVKRYLEIMKQPQAVAAIVAGLKAGGVLSQSKNFYTTVWTAIKRLKASGQVVNTNTGGWGLSEWYAGRSGGIATTEKPKRKKKKSARGGKDAKDTKGTATEGGTEKKPLTGYQAFVARERHEGKSLKEAAAEWRKQKGDGP